MGFRNFGMRPLVHIDMRSDGKKTRTTVDIGAEDIVAICAGIVAIMFAVAMVAGWVEINKYTVGLASFAAAGAVIAQIVKARRGGGSGKGAHPKKNKAA